MKERWDISVSFKIMAMLISFLSSYKCITGILLVLRVVLVAFVCPEIYVVSFHNCFVTTVTLN